MNGFGVEELRDDPYYNIKLDVNGYTPNTYGILVGPAYSMVFSLFLLLTGYVADNYNRKNMLLLSTIVGSIITYLNGSVTNMTQLIVLRFILGANNAFSAPSTYNLIEDYFPPLQRTKAFSLFCILT